MATIAKLPPSSISTSHTERTIHEPRDSNLHRTTITSLAHPTPNIRVLQLTPTTTNIPIRFLPGQWLDVHCPSIPKPGGFTITSSPSKPYLELAIQKSPRNAAAEWLWQEGVVGKEVDVRVGGGFVWPPPSAMRRGGEGVKRVVFLAGGVGVNPLVGMVSFLGELKGRMGVLGFQVVFLYSSKVVKEGDGEVLFLGRLRRIFEGLGGEGELRVFLTGSKGVEEEGVVRRRIGGNDLVEALGPVEERAGTVVYICGVPSMTDEFVEEAKRLEGMREENVLCERWW